MVEILFKETFDDYIKKLSGHSVIAHGKPKKHVLNARDLKSEIGKQTILKDYDEGIDVIQIVRTISEFSGLGNVMVIESQGYKLTQSADPAGLPFPQP